MPAPSALPASQQAKRERLLAADASSMSDDSIPAHVTAPISHNESLPPADIVVSTTAQPTPKVGTTAVDSQELEALQRQASSAELLRGDLAAAMQRLTELESAAKSTHNTDSAPALNFTGTEFTDAELETFGGSKEFITKLVLQVMGDKLNPVLDQLNKKLTDLGQATESTAHTARIASENTFAERVKSAVKDFTEITNHEKWATFLAIRVPSTNYTYMQALQTAHQSANLQNMVEIFDSFRSKYPPVDLSAGYSGAQTSGAVNIPADANVTNILPYSKRKQASEDFRKGRITGAELKVVTDAFDAANKENRIDYTK